MAEQESYSDLVVNGNTPFHRQRKFCSLFYVTKEGHLHEDQLLDRSEYRTFFLPETVELPSKKRELSYSFPVPLFCKTKSDLECLRNLETSIAEIYHEAQEYTDPRYAHGKSFIVSRFDHTRILKEMTQDEVMSQKYSILLSHPFDEKITGVPKSVQFMAMDDFAGGNTNFYVLNSLFRGNPETGEDIAEVERDIAGRKPTFNPKIMTRMMTAKEKYFLKGQDGFYKWQKLPIYYSGGIAYMFVNFENFSAWNNFYTQVFHRFLQSNDTIISPVSELYYVEDI